MKEMAGNIVKRNIAINRMSTSPVNVPRSLRKHTLRNMTSLAAGKCVPLAMVPLLREDSVRRMHFRTSFEMMETAEILMNAVNVNVQVWLVPWLAFERFQGMDDFNRSYKGQPPFEGEAVVPFFETHTMGAHGSKEFYEYAGKHAKADAEVNTMYLEAYNQIFNFRAKNRSPKLFEAEERTRLQADLAHAFWRHNGLEHIKYDFDQAKIDGEVPLTIANAKMPVRGIGTDQGTSQTTAGIRESAATSTQSWDRMNGNTLLRQDADNPGYPDVWAELQDNGITVSLANIELAKNTRAFAKLRERFHGHDDEWLIDMLMSGLTVPDQAYKQPMKIADKTTIFGMSKRYATDSGNLDESAVNGATFMDVPIRLPRIHTGGVLMAIAEITPEQLFERQKDPFFHLSDVETLPEFVRDSLDPEKVDIVTNDRVDIDHDDDSDVFGYEPLNYKWNIDMPQLGGKFYRPEVDAGYDEDRQRFWAVETQNPTLGPDFYLCKNIHTKPFADTISDPFEMILRGEAIIEGNTVFGQPLIEASDDYDKVFEKAPTETIEKPSE